jgi:hypothetical protein
MWPVFAFCVYAIRAAVVVRRIDSVSPSSGTHLGGTRITITGVGFSTDYADGENRVEINGKVCPTTEAQGGGVCMGTCSNANRIICDTPPHDPSGPLHVKVTVDRQFPIPLSSKARFQYTKDLAGSIRRMYPSSGQVCP